MKQITERQYQLMKAKTQRLERIILCRDNELQSKEKNIRNLCARITELEKANSKLKEENSYNETKISSYLNLIDSLANKNSGHLSILDADNEAWKQPKERRPVTEKPVNELTDEEINELIEMKRRK